MRRSSCSFEPKYTERGQRVKRTVDLLSHAGFVTLLHADADVIERDYRTIERLQHSLMRVDS